MGWAGLVTAILEGLLRPLYYWFLEYRQRRSAQEAKDAKAALDLQKRMADEIEALNRGTHKLDATGLRELFERERVRRETPAPAGDASSGSGQTDGPV